MHFTRKYYYYFMNKDKFLKIEKILNLLENLINTRGRSKKYAEFCNFLLIFLYNRLIFQRNLRQGQCTFPGGAFMFLDHF